MERYTPQEREKIVWICLRNNLSAALAQREKEELSLVGTTKSAYNIRRAITPAASY